MDVDTMNEDSSGNSATGNIMCNSEIDNDSFSSFPSVITDIGRQFACPSEVHSLPVGMDIGLGLSRDSTTGNSRDSCERPSVSYENNAEQRLSPAVPCFEEDTQSSWNFVNPQTPILKESEPSTSLALDEDYRNSLSAQISLEASKKELYDDDSGLEESVFPVENLYEYQWPPEKGDFYMLQEQISEFLGVKSFKRKYPELARRTVDMDEKQFLKDRGIVSETQCDLGLTALRSDDVIELMSKDYPTKYQDYVRVLQDKERQNISDKHKEYATATIEKSKMADFIKKAVHSAAEYNAHLNLERREERRACFDLQTFTIHYPQNKIRKLPKEATKPGKYPVALIPGQYQDYYRTYSAQELNYLPINTVLYGPVQELGTVFAQIGSDGSQSDSEDSSGSEGSCCSSQGTHEEGSIDSTSGSEQQNRTKAGTDGASTSRYQPKNKPNAVCKVCQGKKDKNQKGVPEELVHCSQCNNSGHPSCLELTPEIVNVIKTYPWQCMECKMCNICQDPNDEDKMMFCDKCDRGYHTFCVGLKSLPSGRWVCRLCAKCSTCGVRTPGPEGSKIQWQHEFVKVPGPNGEPIRSHQVFCLSCFRQRRR
ncbi:PHD finger protein 10-like [Tachypleus tridentatus]|uniref:PHD finger protein 10-like n=1 Tax=Tachypleus tridentatus TaxID=6853 RepID=UPI003FD3015C